MYQRILVPIDGSTTASRGLDEAIELAGLTHASMRLIHVVDQLSYAVGFDAYAAYDPEILVQVRQAGKQMLEQGRARVAAAGVPVDVLLVDSMASRLSEIVVEQAKSWGADLIVIGTHGRRGVGRLLLGSDAEQIVRVAPVPVLLVRAAPATSSDAGSGAKAGDEARSSSVVAVV